MSALGTAKNQFFASDDRNSVTASSKCRATELFFCQQPHAVPFAERSEGKGGAGSMSPLIKGPFGECV